MKSLRLSFGVWETLRKPSFDVGTTTKTTSPRKRIRAAPPARPVFVRLRRRARNNASSNVGEVSQALRAELQERLAKAGVVVDEARLTHLAYAPEIAQAMLRRQQAEAVIAARQKIVQGAVSMVDMALRELADKHVSCSTMSAKLPWSAISWSSFAAKPKCTP